MPLLRGSEDVVDAGFRVTAGALLVLVAGLVLGWASLVPASLVLLGGLYGAQLAIDDEALDVGAPLFAAGLLVTAELGYWSLEERERVKAEPGEGFRRLAFFPALGIGAFLVAAVLLVLVDGVRASGLAVDVVGAAAAVAALTAIVLLARRRA